MKHYNHKQNKDILWILFGVSYGIISALIFNYNINQKILQGIFILRSTNVKISILLFVFFISVLTSIMGYFRKFIFSIVCFLGFTIGLFIFSISNLCSFCGFESLISVVGMLYIDIFSVVLGIISQIVFNFCYRLKL